MKFGEKIHKLRKQYGFTQAELAEKLGVHHRTIIGYERDGRYDCSSIIGEAASAEGESGKEEAKQLAMELSELFATGELSDEDMDNIMYVMHRAYFQYRESKRVKE